MNAKVNREILAILLLSGCCFASSCSTEPALQSDKVIEEPAKASPTPLEDVVVASEDEIPTWDESTDKAKSSSDREDANK